MTFRSITRRPSNASCTDLCVRVSTTRVQSGVNVEGQYRPLVTPSIDGVTFKTVLNTRKGVCWVTILDYCEVFSSNDGVTLELFA